MSNTTNINSSKQTYFQSRPGVKYQFSDFILCTKKNILIRGDQMIPLNLKAIKCLTLLVTNANKIVLRESFFDHVWNDCYVEGGVLNVNISYLRKILGKNKIKTYAGRGYLFSEQVKVIDDKAHSIENVADQQNITPNEETNKSMLSRIKRFWTTLFL